MSKRARERARRLWPRLLVIAALTALLAVPTQVLEHPEPPARDRPEAVKREAANPGATVAKEFPGPARRRPAGPSAAQLLPYESKHVHIDFGGNRNGRVIINVDHDVPAAQARAAWRALLRRTEDDGSSYRVIYRPLGTQAAGRGQRRPLASAQAFANSFCAFQRGALPATALTPATDHLRAQLDGRSPQGKTGLLPRAGRVQLRSQSPGRATAEFLIDDGESVATYRVALVSSRGGWAVDRLSLLSVRAGA